MNKISMTRFNTLKKSPCIFIYWFSRCFDSSRYETIKFYKLRKIDFTIIFYLY